MAGKEKKQTRYQKVYAALSKAEDNIEQIGTCHQKDYNLPEALSALHSAIKTLANEVYFGK